MGDTIDKSQKPFSVAPVISLQPELQTMPFGDRHWPVPPSHVSHFSIGTMHGTRTVICSVVVRDLRLGDKDKDKDL